MKNLSEINQNRISFLDETLKYYSDTSKRAINKEGKACLYDPATGNKCAVGRHIPEKIYKPFLEQIGISKLFLLEVFPKEIKDLGTDFLLDMTVFHDDRRYWGTNCLTEKGQSFVDEIRLNIYEGKYD